MSAIRGLLPTSHSVRMLKKLRVLFYVIHSCEAGNLCCTSKTEMCFLLIDRKNWRCDSFRIQWDADASLTEVHHTLPNNLELKIQIEDQRIENIENRMSANLKVSKAIKQLQNIGRTYCRQPVAQ